MASFDDILPRLLSLYERGQLVPFIGSGLSIPTCPDWRTLVARLEAAAGLASGGGVAPADLIRRANAATSRLRLDGRMAAAVRNALDCGYDSPPKQTTRLAMLWWPLVVTTNYDDCYVSAFDGKVAKTIEQLEIVGRNPPDCQRVLSSLYSPGPPMLWCVQGYLGAPCGTRAAPAHLADELIVGHQEYSAVTHREPHFRRAFAEVFRQRSLLFVGSGLADPYLQGLFTEILEFYGTSSRRHYALVRRGEVDPAFVRSRFNVVVVEYARHSQLPVLLRKLATAAARRPMQSHWSYSLTGAEQLGDKTVTDLSDLEVVRAGLPWQLGPGECIAFSAGGSGDRFYISRQMRESLLNRPEVAAFVQRASLSDKHVSPASADYVRRFGASPVFAVRARRVEEQQGGRVGRRDLRVVSDATAAFLDAAADAGYAVARMQLLAAGGGRAFPAWASFSEMVRAFGAWRRRTGHPLRLAIHVVTPEVYLNLSAGFIDPISLMVVDELRFWVEIVHAAGHLERHVLDRAQDTALAEVLAELGIAPGASWRVEVLPAPARRERPRLLGDVEHMGLLELGVAPGSTIRLTRHIR